MRVGFTGTRHLDRYGDCGIQVIDNVLPYLDATEFVTGSCQGVDTYVGLTLIKIFPQAKHRVIVPANRKYVDYWWHPIDEWLDKGIDIEVELMPQGTSFRNRDQRIVDCSDELIAFARFPENHGGSRRSGTWLTVRLAHQSNVPVRPPFIFSVLCTSTENGGNVLAMNTNSDGGDDAQGT